MSFLNHLIDMLHQHAQGQAQQPQPQAQPQPGHFPLDVVSQASGMNQRLPQAGRAMFQQPQSFNPLQVQPRSSIQYGDQGMQMQGGFGLDPQYQHSNDALQGYNQNDLSEGIQGGVVNQGYIPLQSSLPRSRRR